MVFATVKTATISSTIAHNQCNRWQYIVFAMQKASINFTFDWACAFASSLAHLPFYGEKWYQHFMRTQKKVE